MVDKFCSRCNLAFSVPMKERDRKFCSRQCYLADLAERNRAATTFTTFACKHCGKPFTRSAGSLKQYRAKFGKDPMYCSVPCSAIGRRADHDSGRTYVCVQCGNEYPIPRTKTGLAVQSRKLCSTECRSKFRSERSGRPFEQGGTSSRTMRGYVRIMVPAYLTGTGKRKEMLEHRFLMEKYIGRPLLRQESVHHKNGQTGDNRLENLELWSKAQPAGQRVTDKIAFAIDMAQLYPDFLREAGYKLVAVGRADHT